MSNRGESGPRSGRSDWARAVAVVAVAAILVGGALFLFVFRSLRDLPGDAVDKTREVLADLESVADSFRRGRIETSFVGFATRVSGSSYFQFATLRQTEVFTRQDSASLLWGRLQLPDVVVAATAPVETTYYLDLEEPWTFRLEGATVWVETPSIRFNRPSVDVSKIHWEVRASSLLRDEQTALEQLRAGITGMAEQRAREQIDLVRELGRNRVRRFVRTWLLSAFSDGADYRVEVRFPDEPEVLDLPGLQLVPESPD